MEKLLPHANLTASETSAGKPSAEPPPAGQQAHKTTSELLKDCMTSQNLNSVKLKCSRYLFTPMLMESQVKFLSPKDTSGYSQRNSGATVCCEAPEMVYGQQDFT